MQNMAKRVRPNHGERKLLDGRTLLQKVAMVLVYKQPDMAIPLHIFSSNSWGFQTRVISSMASISGT